MTLAPKEEWEYEQQVKNHPQDDGVYPTDEPYPGDEDYAGYGEILERLTAERDAAVAALKQAEKERDETWVSLCRSKETELRLEAHVAALEAQNTALQKHSMLLEQAGDALAEYIGDGATEYGDKVIAAWRAPRGQA